jgi:flavin reductase (DIM6/NTAB) family NADH-FMN oxidoreductase RutF
MLKTLDPAELAIRDLHSVLLSTIVPRPIALASTVDAEGTVNLSPFSFFNVFSANPPILIFSPARRVRDNSTKDTLDNVLEIGEVCINIVNSAIVQQVSLASTEYEKGVNEFVKSGLHETPSIKIKPPRVMESPVSMECKVTEVKSLGDEGGAGNLVIAEVVLIHVDDSVFNADGKIDPIKLDPIARMGDNWYCGVSQETVFAVEKPLVRKGIGFDKLPESIRKSKILTGNDLAVLANVEEIPKLNEVIFHLSSNERVALAEMDLDEKHKMAQKQLILGLHAKAWAVLLS